MRAHEQSVDVLAVQVLVVADAITMELAGDVEDRVCLRGVLVRLRDCRVLVDHKRALMVVEGVEVFPHTCVRGALGHKLEVLREVSVLRHALSQLGFFRLSNALMSRLTASSPPVVGHRPFARRQYTTLPRIELLSHSRLMCVSQSVSHAGWRHALVRFALYFASVVDVMHACG